MISNKERRTTMKEEDELLKNSGTKIHSMVPEGYFDNFSKELMNKLPEKEQTSTPQENNNYLATYQAWIYMAAMFCGLMFSVRVVVGPLNKTLLFLQQRKLNNSQTNILKRF